MGYCKILQKLECPVCKRYMRPPIYMCEVGHSVCKDCKCKLTACGICRNSLPHNARNYLVESICEELTFPCTYNDRGCTFHHKLDGGLIKHEKEQCKFRPLQCPLRDDEDCRWVDFDEALKDHLDLRHPDQLYKVSELEFLLKDQSPIFFVYCFEQLFQVCQENGIFHAHMIGPKKEALKFKYIYTMLDSQFPEFTLKIENNCNEKCNKETSGNYRITLPNFLHDYDFVTSKIVIMKTT